MKKITGIIIACFVTITAFAQNNSQMLLTVENEKITVDDFLKVYNKNNNAANAIDPKSVEEYLELFINFKLKVKEAEALGMDTAKDFIRELRGYRTQLAKPYLTDQEMTDELIKEAYERMKTDVHTSHILVRVGLNALPADTMKARNRLNSILRVIKNPEKDFGKTAAEWSEDPSAAQNYGDLGYFTAFQMVYPFETAAYNTEVGKVSKPVRTRFGYHLLYIHDKRPARGQIKAAHILIKTDEKAEDIKQANAEQKINEIYERIKKGESFEALARQFSDDKSSAVKGGELPMFGTGRMVPEFEDAAFALKSDGEVSAPIKTQYGWHIIKRLEYEPIPPFEEVAKEIKRKISRDGRSQKTKTAFLDKLKNTYQYKVDEKALKEMVSCMTDDFFEGQWSAEKECAGKEKFLFSLVDVEQGSKKYEFTQADLAQFMQSNRRYERTEENLGQKETILGLILDRMVEAKVMQLEDDNLEEKYPEFKHIMKEYRDGILLFELMDEKVWTKAIKDTAGLEAFYEANKTKFMWDKRLDAKIYVCKDEAVAKKARKLAKKQAKKGWSNDRILEKINADSQLALDIREGKYLKGDDPIIDKIEWKQGLSENMNIDNQTIFVSVLQVLPPQPKAISEARGIITAAYQTKLEEDWIKELRNKYNFKVDENVLKSIK